MDYASVHPKLSECSEKSVVRETNSIAISMHCFKELFIILQVLKRRLRGISRRFILRMRCFLNCMFPTKLDGSFANLIKGILGESVRLAFIRHQL